MQGTITAETALSTATHTVQLAGTIAKTHNACPIQFTSQCIKVSKPLPNRLNAHCKLIMHVLSCKQKWAADV